MSSDSSDSMRFLPVGLDVQSRDCLVVGGGSVGTRKAITLARAGAVVTVVSPAVTDELAEKFNAGAIRWVQDSFREEHAGGAFLVVAATDSDERNAAIVRAAVQNHALACDASSVERSQVIFGALLQNEGITVAVFTGGRDPALARQARDRIRDLIDQKQLFKPQP
jgi:siroheme synthase-like protein